jgi:hypothetical protein
LTSAVDVARADPPDEVAYHWMLVPVAVRFVTVGLLIAQKLCVALPVGADGVVVTVTATANREEDSQPLTVWLA